MLSLNQAYASGATIIAALAKTRLRCHPPTMGTGSPIRNLWADGLCLIAVIAYCTAMVAVASPEGRITQVLGNEAFYGWIGVLGTFLAISGSVAVGYVHHRYQKEIDASDRITAIYIVARAAGKEVLNLDRYNRSAAESEKERISDINGLAGFRRKWNAWIPDRYHGLAAMMERYDATGRESGDFMTHLLTVITRINWLAKIGGATYASRDLNDDEQTLLAEAATSIVISLYYMRRELDTIRQRAGQVALQSAQFPATRAPHEFKHRSEMWAAIPRF